MSRRLPSTPRATIRLRWPRRVGLCVLGIGLWLSGGLWLLFHYFLERPGQFGLSAHPLEPWWLRLHAAFAFAGIWMFGLLWGVHIAPGWSAGRRRRSGAWLVGILAWLTLSGYLLYYLGNEQARTATSLLHWSAALACPILFAAHRQAKRRR